MGLKYVGRQPDSDYSVVHKKWVDDRYTATKVDLAYVNSEVTAVSSGLSTPAYVDDQDNLRAKTANVNSADNNYIPLTQKGQANGVASLGSDNYIIASQLPTLVTERKPVFKNADTVYLTGVRAVTTTNAKEFKAATLTIADPGFPYIPLVLSSIQGGATTGAQGPKSVGTGNYGQVSVLDPNNKKYGWAICGDLKSYAFHTVIPYGAPLTDEPVSVSGPLTLDLWLGLWAGSTYVFTDDSFVFSVLIYPSA